MKKKALLLSALVILGAISLYAQDKKESARKVGTVRVGWHSASQVLDGDKQDGTTSNSTFYAGFARDSKIIPLLWFGSGLEYFQNGINYTDNTSRAMHTISIPVDLKLKLGPVYALAGFAANFMVSEKIKSGDSSANPIESNKSNWFDAPFFMGAGLKILFISVEARYHWGTIEARNSLYNRYLQIGAGFTF